MSRCPREGKRVQFDANPAARMIYAGSQYPVPRPGEKGTITSLPIGRGNSTCSPGGHMVYVDWDETGTVGVFRKHVQPARGR